MFDCYYHRSRVRLARFSLRHRGGLVGPRCAFSLRFLLLLHDFVSLRLSIADSFGGAHAKAAGFVELFYYSNLWFHSWVYRA